MAFERDEKTEAPTPKRRSEAREKGQVARSTEVSSAAGIIMAFVYFMVMGPQMASGVRDLVTDLLSNACRTKVGAEDIQHLYGQLLSSAGAVLMPFFVYMMVVGIISNLFQVGWLWTMKPMKPKFDKLNLIKGLQRSMFSKDSLIKLLFSSAKVVVILWILYATLLPRVGEMIQLSDQSSLLAAIILTIKIVCSILVRVCMFFLVLAVVDYAWQRYKFEDGLKMTKQEIQDERKSSDIDPKYRARIRARQIQIARSRMMSAVPEANVVITNPTTYAVAIKYDMDNMDSPIVVAKGARLIAKRIKEIAIANNIPVIENKPLARDLFKSVEVNAPIPIRLYKAVAQILAYVYNLKRTGKA